MQNSYIYSFRASVSIGPISPNLRVRRTQSLFAAFITCFRGGRRQSERWVLRVHRRVVWGSQVAAWDVVEPAGMGLCLCVGLLGPNLDLVV